MLVSSRARLYAIVAACAVAAAGLTVGVTLATRTPTPKRPAGQAGSPPLVLDLGVRTDPEAVALRRASNLYDGGKLAQAAPIFARYGSLEAQVGTALANWPRGFGTLTELAQTHPRSSLALLHQGLGLYWNGDLPAAKAAWRKARTAQPDTSYSLRAEDLLYPRFPRSLPTFVPSFPSPAVLDRLSPPQQLAYLEHHAGTERGKLLYGVAMQRLGRQVSAVREFDAASKLAPDDAEAQVAAAVGRFDKADPSRDVLAAWPAGAALSEEPERPLPPRAVPAVARQREAGAAGTAARTQSRTEDAARPAVEPVSDHARRNQDRLTRR